MIAGRFDPNDPRCTKCGRPFAELDEPYSGFGGTVEATDGSPDEVLCIDCMTPAQRELHVNLVDPVD